MLCYVLKMQLHNFYISYFFPESVHKAIATAPIEYSGDLEPSEPLSTVLM